MPDGMDIESVAAGVPLAGADWLWDWFALLRHSSDHGARIMIETSGEMLRYWQTVGSSATLLLFTPLKSALSGQYDAQRVDALISLQIGAVKRVRPSWFPAFPVASRPESGVGAALPAPTLPAGD